jgi:hypothetical protein
MCVFSHPIKAKYQYPQWLIERCNGVEILNTKHDGDHYLRPQSTRLYERVKAQRSSVVAVAGMDFHSVKNYNGVRLRLTKEGELNENFILGSLQGGDFLIIKDGVAFESYGPVRRTAAQARIIAMDMAHVVHERMSSAGIVVPKGLKRAIRKVVEGH